MIKTIIEQVLKEHFMVRVIEDGVYAYTIKGDGHTPVYVIDTMNYEDMVFIYTSLTKELSDARQEYIKNQYNDEDNIVTEDYGTFCLSDGTLLRVFTVPKDAIEALPDDQREGVLQELFELGPDTHEEMMQWVKYTLLNVDYNYLMSEYAKDRSEEFNFHEQGEGMMFCRSTNTDAAYLINTTDNKLYTLVDDDGCMVGFTSDDVDESVRKLDVDSNNAVNLMAHYRFWVYDYKDGKAEVEWTVMPDGLFFRDEDGFGAEKCRELIATAIIGKNGKLLKPFTPLPRCMEKDNE